MKGTIKDESSRQSGEYRYELKSRRIPRLGPGENFYIPVAPGPRAVVNYVPRIAPSLINQPKRIFLSPIGNFRFFLLSCLLLFCINVKVEAVPVFETQIELDLPYADNCAWGTSSFAYDSVLYRYPWWINPGLSDAANVEWIPAQEFRYKAIENILYNFLGGSYEPGSVGHPFRPDFKYLVIVEFEGNDDDEQCDDSLSQPPGKQLSSDIISGRLFHSDTLRYTSMETNLQEPARFNISEVPEPSSVFLFTITAFGYLWLKNKNG